MEVDHFLFVFSGHWLRFGSNWFLVKRNPMLLGINEHPETDFS